MFQIIKITTIIGFAVLPGCMREVSLVSSITDPGTESAFQDISSTKIYREPKPSPMTIGERNNTTNMTTGLNNPDDAGSAPGKLVNKCVEGYFDPTYTRLLNSQVFFKKDKVSGVIDKYAEMHSKKIKQNRVLNGFLKIDITN